MSENEIFMFSEEERQRLLEEEKERKRREKQEAIERAKRERELAILRTEEYSELKVKLAQITNDLIKHQEQVKEAQEVCMENISCEMSVRGSNQTQLL